MQSNQAIITTRNVDNLQELVDLYPQTCQAVSLEITSLESIKNVVKSANKRFGQIDVLVNNAGKGMRSSIEEALDDDVLHLFETNLFGAVKLTKEILPQMRKSRQGIIINISSLGAVQVNPGSGYYSATKAALENISFALAKEVKPLGIHVMIVEPGPFRTKFRVDSLTSDHNQIADYEITSGAVARNYKENPFNQNGDPDKAGQVIVEMVNNKQYPHLLILGKGMVDLEKQVLTKRIEEIEKWQEYSLRTDFDE